MRSVTLTIRCDGPRDNEKCPSALVKVFAPNTAAWPELTYEAKELGWHIQFRNTRAPTYCPRCRERRVSYGQI
jgi:hypothetical protein